MEQLRLDGNIVTLICNKSYILEIPAERQFRLLQDNFTLNIFYGQQLPAKRNEA